MAWPIGSEASFERSDEPERTVLRVVPARPSVSYILLTTFQFCVYAVVCVLVAAFTLKGDWSIPAGIAAAFALNWWVDWRHFARSQWYRRRTALIVTSEGLGAGEGQFPIDDIADFHIRAAGSSPETALIVSSSGGAVFVGSGVGGMMAANAMAGASNAMNAAFAASQNLGRNLRNHIIRRQRERSYLLTIRSKQGSKTKVLAGGLTLDCAESLMNDLVAALRKRQES